MVFDLYFDKKISKFEFKDKIHEKLKISLNYIF